MESENEAELGPLLRGFRHRSGLTLEALAAQSGVSLRTISDIERGVRRTPHRYTLNTLAAALNLSPQDAETLYSLVSRVRSLPRAQATGPFVLPRMVPDFTGRNAELQRAMQMLVSNRSPIITVTGPVGFGTTTFAVALARAAEEDFEMTVFLPMVGSENNAPIHPEEAARNLVRAITPSAKPVPDSDVVAQFQESLIGRRILIVCDDVESESQIRPLLPAHGESAMILTSWLPLAGLDGVFRLPLEPLEVEDSVRLLESIIPEQQRTPQDTLELAHFCKNVPLGLRISGNQVASNPGLTAGGVFKRLDSHTNRSLGAFSAGDRSLLAVFEASYERLRQDQQTVFRRLCLTDGNFATTELLAVLAGVSELKTQAIVQELGELSIVEFDGSGRVRLHGFVDVFARMQINADADAAAARQRADEYLISGVASAVWWFRDLSARPAPELSSEVRPLVSFEEATEWLFAEGENWPVALQRAQAAGKHELILSLVRYLHWFAQLWPQELGWLELWDLALESAEATGDAAQLVRFQEEIAWFSLKFRRDVPRALLALEGAEQAALKLGNPRHTVQNLLLRAQADLEVGEFEDGLRRCDEAVRVIEREAETIPGLLLHSLMIQAELLVKLGRHEQAMQKVLESRDMTLELYDSVPRIPEFFLANLARITAESFRLRGDLETCISVSTDALEWKSRLQGHPVLIEILMGRGSAYRDLGDDESAARDFLEIESVFANRQTYPELSA
ncbi:helix-turn-helix domain-containing protein [Leucobacter viscericola]|uniref:Helix-turn-helix domain-containing protein n=1 Tax=Leucobacter viscericola TaxID=2714935 RepID=A0A6G7XIJ0_9MICO|nr:helix-turn-helix transcriptional regulator [Leucobacter viscericola]QIK64385.1 helix-turn-helix domain-containing protein [Leucobacter viscericola]